jgi:pyruvate dehydrogenase E2 component (dihydrolipoamide acetyltransferase)
MRRSPRRPPGVLAEIIVHEGTTVPVNAIVARIETEKGAAVARLRRRRLRRHLPRARPRSVPRQACGTGCPAAPAAPAPSGLLRPARSRSASAPSRRRSCVAWRRTRAWRSAPSPVRASPGASPRRTWSSTSRRGAGRTERGAESPCRAVCRPRSPSRWARTHEPMFNPWPGDVVEPMSKIRRLTADHMRQAKQVAAHVTSFFEIDLTRIAGSAPTRAQAFEAETGQKLTFLPFIIRAVVENLRRHPVLNATVSGTDVILRKRFNIGIAVALDPTGLIVPVLKDADGLNLTGITRGTNDLAARARSKKLSPMDVQDATFTITNPGVFGSLMGTPIIPVGTTAILCLGAIEKRPKVITGPTARTPSPSAPAPTSRSASTTAWWTAPTPTVHGRPQEDARERHRLSAALPDHPSHGRHAAGARALPRPGARARAHYFRRRGAGTGCSRSRHCRAPSWSSARRTTPRPYQAAHAAAPDPCPRSDPHLFDRGARLMPTRALEIDGRVEGVPQRLHHPVRRRRVRPALRAAVSRTNARCVSRATRRGRRSREQSLAETWTTRRCVGSSTLSQPSAHSPEAGYAP